MLVTALRKAISAGDVESVVLDKKGGFEVVSKDKNTFIFYQGKGDELKVKEELCLYFLKVFVDMLTGLSEEYTVAYDTARKMLRIEDKVRTIQFLTADPVLMLNRYVKKGGVHILETFADSAKNNIFALSAEMLKDVLRNVNILREYNEYVTLVGDKSGVYFVVGKDNAHQVRLHLADATTKPFSVVVNIEPFIKVLSSCTMQATITVIDGTSPIRIEDEEVTYVILPRGR